MAYAPRCGYEQTFFDLLDRLNDGRAFAYEEVDTEVLRKYHRENPFWPLPEEFQQTAADSVRLVSITREGEDGGGSG